MTKSRRFLLLMFLTLLFFSLTRIICQGFCLASNWYQIMLTDYFHHYRPEGIIFSWVVFLIVVMLIRVSNAETRKAEENTEIEIKRTVKAIVLYGLATWIVEWGIYNLF